MSKYSLIFTEDLGTKMGPKYRGFLGRGSSAVNPKLICEKR